MFRMAFGGETWKRKRDGRGPDPAVPETEVDLSKRQRRQYIATRET